MRQLIAVGLVAALMGCAATGPEEPVGALESPIIDGDRDDGDPAVVAVALGDIAYCSGTLVSGRVVLTAAHCIHQQLPDGVFFGSSLQATAQRIRVVAARTAPGFDATDFSDDIGVLVLERDAPIAPVTLPRGPIQDKTILGARVRVVGFGTTHDPRDTEGKHEGIARVQAVDDVSFSISPDPARPCTGDSGGPALLEIDGVETLIGVTSRGDAACQSSATETRVDTYLSEFVSPMVDAATPGAVSVGETCLSADACAAGRCYAPPDAPSFPYCAAPCVANRDCPMRMECFQDQATEGECRYVLPSPGALGGTCVSSACEGGACMHLGQGPPICAERCVPGVPSCPGGTTCEPVVEPTGLSACILIRAEEASCNFGRTDRQRSAAPGSAAMIALCGCFFWSRRRLRIRRTR